MSTTDSGRPPAAVQSVDRAISVLELIALKGEAGVTEIADELGVHKSTASRLVTALEARGLVEQLSNRGKYTIGFGIVRLAGAATRHMDLATLGQPICQQLADELGETVNLAILDNEVAVNVSQAHGSSAVVAQNWVGRQTPLHATSSGKVLLASLPEDERLELLRQPLEEFTSHTVTDTEHLMNDLVLVAKDGYSRCFEEYEVGMHAVAVAVHGQDGGVAAAISATGPAYRLSRRRSHHVADELRRGAAELAAQLGYIG